MKLVRIQFNADNRAITHHFEPIRPVNHEQNEISYFADVNHGIEVAIALDEGNALLLATNNGDRPLDFIESLFRVAADEGLEQGRLAHSGRPDDRYDDRRGLVVWCTVDEGNMETGLVPLNISSALSVCAAARLGRECLRRSCKLGLQREDRLTHLFVESMLLFLSLCLTLLLSFRP